MHGGYGAAKRVMDNGQGAAGRAVAKSPGEPDSIFAARDGSNDKADDDDAEMRGCQPQWRASPKTAWPDQMMSAEQTMTMKTATAMWATITQRLGGCQPQRRATPISGAAGVDADRWTDDINVDGKGDDGDAAASRAARTVECGEQRARNGFLSARRTKL